MKTLILSDNDIKLLKEALLIAEIQRDKDCEGAGKVFEELHIKIDEQVK